MNHFFDHFKKSWFFFFLITYRMIKMSFQTTLSVIYELLSMLCKVLLNFFRLLVWVFVNIYFSKRALFDGKKKHKNPLEKKEIAKRSSQLIERIHKKQDVLCLGLDKTLIYLHAKKPINDKNSVLLKVSQIDGKSVNTYLTPRPFLKEFLAVVTLKVC